MAGFTDLVAAAMPSLVSADGAGTEGRSWRYTITGFADATGAAIDLSGATCVCKILDKVDGVTVLTPTATGDSTGTVTITATPTATAGLADGKHKRLCVWSLVITDASGSQAQVWGPTDSRFWIEAE